MQNTAMTNNKKIVNEKKKKKKITLKVLKEQKYLMLLSLPFVVYVFIFSYIPLLGWTMAFQDYQPQLGIFQQKWVGLQQFQMLFADKDFWHAIRNSLGLSIYGIVAGTIAPIVFALLLNEIISTKFKKTVQTISYLPHFVSMVLVASLVQTMFSTQGGVITTILMKIGLMHKAVNLMTQPKLFWLLVTLIGVWKETGWGAIIYIAAISGIDQELYEAAEVDGANRFHKMWHITLPAIKPTIVMLLVLSIPGLLGGGGTDVPMLLANPMVMDVANNIPYYTLTTGINGFRFSYGTAIGIFGSIVSLVLIFSANKFSDWLGQGRAF
jgi:putative aldouronate transport system permease protein